MSNQHKQRRGTGPAGFTSTGEMEKIREQERIDREKRKINAERMRREDLRRRKRMKQIKDAIIAWSILLLIVIVIVAVIMGVVSLFKGDEEEKMAAAGDKIPEEQTLLVENFVNSDDIIYTETAGSNAYIMNDMAKNLIFDDAELTDASGSELSILADTYVWNSSFGKLDEIKEIVRDFPIYSNGYIWSCEKSMTSPVTGSYTYDTNAAFISAVCEICAWDEDASFLDAIDITGEEKGDISKGMTVREKLDAAIAHLFDSSDYLNGGGVRYNEKDGLVYVRTPENDGTDKGRPSNLFFNYRSGYIDTYINLTFNKAIQDLEKLYKLIGEDEQAKKFSEYASKNKQAINNMLYDSSLGRYVACIDDRGDSHDNGFTAINLLAVSTGVADKKRAEKVLSWIEGERNVKSDTLSSKDIMNNNVMPLFSTVRESGNWWYLGKKYSLDEDAAFGKYWMNGAKSAISANYYILAGNSLGHGETDNRAKNLVSAYAIGKFAYADKEYGEPRLYYSLAASNGIRQLSGISAEGKNLILNPRFEEGGRYGIKGIAFLGNDYDFLFDDKSVYVMCDSEDAVKVSIGGFSSMAAIELSTIKGDEIVSSKEVAAGPDGYVTISQIFGGDTYLKLEEIVKEK